MTTLENRPATALLGEKATPEAVARINELYGFDRPLITQYLTYMGKLLQGDFGVSMANNRPIADLLAGQTAVLVAEHEHVETCCGGVVHEVVGWVGPVLGCGHEECC